MLGLVLGLGASLIGGAIASSTRQSAANRTWQNMQNRVRKERNALENLFNKEYYQSMLDRSETQQMLGTLRQQGTERTRQYRNAAAVTGATPESVVSQMNGEAEAYGDAVSQMAGQEDRWKSTVMSNYLNQRSMLDDKEYDLYRQRYATQVGQASQGAGMAMSALGQLAPTMGSFLEGHWGGY